MIGWPSSHRADDGDDVARLALVDVNALVGVHLQQAADTLLLVLRGVDHVGASSQRAGVDAQVGQLADVGVGHDLEREGSERSLRVGRTLVLCVGLGVRALDRRNIERGRHVVDDCVEQLLNALVLVGGAHEDRVDLAGDNALAQGDLELFDGELFVHEDLLHERVVAVSGSVNELLAVHFGVLDELGRNGVHRLRIGHALLVSLEVPRGHGHQVDDAPEVVLGAHRQLRGDGVGTETVAHGLDSVDEVSAHAVVLVDEGDARNTVALCLTPHGLRLRLHARDRVEDGDGAVKNAQGALDLGREVHVTGGVDDLEAVRLALFGTARVVPEARGGSGGDGNATLLLLDHPVHGGSTVVDLTDLVGLAGVVKNALGRRRLARVDVGHDADVARIFEFDLSHVSDNPFDYQR